MSPAHRSPAIYAIAAVLLFAAACGARAQGPAAAPPGPDCMSALLNVSDCLTYVQAGSKARRPDKGCCPELAGLVDSQPQCLCELLGGAAESYGVKVDLARALALPGVCHVSTPPVSLCSVFGIPVASPMGPSASSTVGPSPSGGPLMPGSSSAPMAFPPSGVHQNQGCRSKDHMFLIVLPYIMAAIGIF